MTGLRDMDPTLIRQYSSAYGPFTTGDYSIGDTIAIPGTSGEVIWSYQSQRGLVYVLDTGEGWPSEIKAHEVQS